MKYPSCKYWGRGYPKCELPQAKSKIALVLPALNFKASPFSLFCCGGCSGHRQSSLGGPPYPSIPPARDEPHALVLGWKGRGETDRADKYTLASPNSLLGKVNYIGADCACTRQSFSTVQLCPALPRVFPS